MDSEDFYQGSFQGSFQGEEDQGYGDQYGGGDQDHYGHEQDHDQGYEDPDGGHGQQYQDSGLQQQDGGNNTDSGTGEGYKKSIQNIMDMIFGKISQNKQFQPKPEHAHSRFAMDPNHHSTMQSFHKISGEGLTDAHIESFVHIGIYFLAQLAKRSGMTAMHAEENEQEAGSAGDQAYGNGQIDGH